MICKLCKKEMVFYRHRREEGNSYDCNNCDATYNPFYDVFALNFGKYSVYIEEGNTRIWYFRSMYMDGMTDIYIDLQGEHYNLTEERIEKAIGAAMTIPRAKLLKALMMAAQLSSESDYCKHCGHNRDDAYTEFGDSADWTEFYYYRKEWHAKDCIMIECIDEWNEKYASLL